MTSNIESLQPGQVAATPGFASHTKPLWAAVGILGVAVLGMGATLIYNQRAPVAPAATVLAAASFAPAAALSVPPLTAAPQALAAVAAPAEKPAPVKKVVKHIARPAPATAPVYSGVSPAPSSASYPSSYPPSYPTSYPTSYPPTTHAPVVAAAPVCAVCGTVDSITPVVRSSKPEGPGLGTLAGGVLGAVLGHQVGGGNGRNVGAILGAVGGGFAGNAIENRVRSETVYRVGVRMEDGSRRSVELAQAPSVGSHVTVEGGTLRNQDGAVFRAPAPVAPRVAQQPTNVNYGR